MILERAPVFLLSAVVCASPAWSESRPTYESLWGEATRKPSCVPANRNDFTLVTCKDDFTLWYFTNAKHPAHPGVIKRFVEEKNGSLFVREEGYSFAPESAQPAFKAWLAQIKELDQRVKEDIARRKSQDPTGPQPK
jgi:hypothetical protein